MHEPRAPGPSATTAVKQTKERFAHRRQTPKSRLLGQSQAFLGRAQQVTAAHQATVSNAHRACVGLSTKPGKHVSAARTERSGDAPTVTKGQHPSVSGHAFRFRLYQYKSTPDEKYAAR